MDVIMARDANLNKSKFRRSCIFPFLTRKGIVQSRDLPIKSQNSIKQEKNFPQIPNICQNMSERCILCAFICFIWKIQRLVQESGRFGLYTGDSSIIWESCHRCHGCMDVWFQNISIPTPRGLLEIPRGRVSEKLKFLKESMNQNWIFQRDGCSIHKPSMGGIWIISETTHWMIAPITIRREERNTNRNKEYLDKRFLHHGLALLLQ